MSAETLLALAARCEKAEGPDRYVDYWAAFYSAPHTIHGDPDNPNPPAYTASLDAAMTLAEGCGGEVTFFKDGTAKAFLWQPYPLAVEAKAATPALALCAAALRARAASCDTHPKDGDASSAAPLVSGAVGEAETPENPSISNPPPHGDKRT